MLPVGCGNRGSGARTGRLRRAYKSVFCRDDKSEFANFDRRLFDRDPLFHFYRDLLGKPVLDDFDFRCRHSFLGADKCDRLVVM